MKFQLLVILLTVVSGQEEKIKHTTQMTEAPISSPCVKLQNDFASAVGAFMECAGLNSSPIHFCMSCVEKFLEVRRCFGNIHGSRDHDMEGKLCFDSLVASDKINIITHLHQLANQLWDRAYCTNCFVNITIDENRRENLYQLRSDVQQFMIVNNNATFCFLQANATANRTVCDSCSKIYGETNKRYNDMDSLMNKEVCMDVTDAMNRTRRLWSRVYNCHNVQRDDLPVAVLSAFILVFPAVFYIGNAVNGTRLERRIVRQKRMTPRLRSRTAPELRRLLPDGRSSPPPVRDTTSPLSTVIEEREPRNDTPSDSTSTQSSVQVHEPASFTVGSLSEEDRSVDK